MELSKDRQRGPFSQSSLNGTYAQIFGLQYKTSCDELEQDW